MRNQIIRVLLAGFGLLCTSCNTGLDGNGTVTLAVTDAASDDLTSLIVDVTSVTLTRQGGTTVGVLPSPVSIDFATLQDVSQVLNAVSVPTGFYTSASITIDFTGATAYLSGSSTPATVLDMDGMPLTGAMTFPVTIGNSLQVAVNRNKILELDFDLDQSVVVDTMANSVMIEPTIVMRVDRTDPKEFVLVGELVATNGGSSSLTMEVQTFAGATLTNLGVRTNTSTVFQVDGVAAQGTGGFTNLAGEPAGTWIQVYGAIDPGTGTVTAAYIEAGSGTYNGGTDIVEGHIIGRTGGAGANAMLTVLGYSENAAHNAFQFNTTFTVSVDFANTNVLQRGSTVNCDTDDLNVGQRIRAFGTLAGMTLNATATDSVVRMQPTRLLGFSNANHAGTTLDIDVARMGIRDQSSFTWTEGGTTPADPDALVAQVGSLADGLSIQMGTAVEVIGFVTAVDDASSDFTATSVINRDLAPSLLLLFDRPSGHTLTPTFHVSEITLALSGTSAINELAVVDDGFVGTTVIPQAPSLTIAPQFGLGLYMIRDRTDDSVAIFLTFPTFAVAMDALALQGATIFNFAAIGQYDDMTNRMQAGLVVATVN